MVRVDIKSVGRTLGRYETLIIALLIVSAFLLIFRSSGTLKVADAALALLAAAVLARAEMRRRFMRFISRQSAYVRVALLLFICFLVGQGIGYLFEDITPNIGVLRNYARVLFNFGIFFLLAYLICENPRALTYVSITVFVAPAVILPVFTTFGDWHGFPLLSGGRLAGFFENPILLGMWLSVVFLVGLGLLLSAKRWWSKVAALAWLVVIANFILWAASRSAWVALAVCLIGWCAYLLFLKRSEKVIMIVGATLIAFTVGYATIPNVPEFKMQPWVRERVVMFVENPLQEQIRVPIWRSGTEVAFSHPFGFGLLNSTGLTPVFSLTANGEYVLSSSPSNTLLEVMFYGGWGALAAFGALLTMLTRSAYKVFRQPEEVGDLEVAWILGTPLVFLNIFFNDGFLLRLAWYVFAITFGVLVSRTERFGTPRGALGKKQ